MKGRRLDDRAEAVLPDTVDGRSGRQEKFDADVTSKGFSQIYVNSSMRYAALLFDESDATKVIRRVPLLMSSCRVGHAVVALEKEGVYA